MLLAVFWDENGIICLDFKKREQRVNSISYYDLIEHTLKPAIRRQRHGLLRKGVLFQHDHAGPHRLNFTKQKLQDLRLEVLPHLADLAPSDYHLFGALKFDLAGSRFSNGLDIENFVWSWFKSKSKDFYEKGITNLVKRWELCVKC